MDHFYISVPCAKCHNQMDVDADAFFSVSLCTLCFTEWQVRRELDEDDDEGSGEDDTLVIFTFEDMKRVHKRNMVARLLTLAYFFLIFTVIFSISLYLSTAFSHTFFGSRAFSIAVALLMIPAIWPVVNLSTILGNRTARRVVTFSHRTAFTHTVYLPARIELAELGAPVRAIEITDSLILLAERCQNLLDKVVVQINGNPEDMVARGAKETLEDLLRYIEEIRGEKV